jgi:glycerol-3-phosphate dehydrogenase
VALCGAVKNVIAIACGAIEAAYGSYNMQVAFIMRVIEELKGIIVKCGGDEETVYSPAGIGDIILTATSTKSRNYRFGQTLVLNGALSIRPLNELAPVKQVLTGVEFPKSSNDGVNHDMTVEGRDTATALKGFLLRYELSFPAIFEVVKIIERGIILEDELFKICK